MRKRYTSTRCEECGRKTHRPITRRSHDDGLFRCDSCCYKHRSTVLAEGPNQAQLIRTVDRLGNRTSFTIWQNQQWVADIDCETPPTEADNDRARAIFATVIREEWK
jgi:hypothetical protein